MTKERKRNAILFGMSKLHDNQSVAKSRLTEKIQMLGRTSMMDRRGEGVPIILRESETLSGKRPEYRLLDGSELKLTFFSTHTPSLVSQPVLGERLGEKLGETPLAILAAMRQDPSITIAALASALKISSTAVENHIARLRARHLLVRVGPDRGGHWEVLAP